jgi:hypothetical protein
LLTRSIAAAIASMAAKGYRKIEQKDELYSIVKLGTEPSTPLEPEERALARTLLDEYGFFDFDEITSELNASFPLGFAKHLLFFRAFCMDRSCLVGLGRGTCLGDRPSALYPRFEPTSWLRFIGDLRMLHHSGPNFAWALR